MLFSENMTMDIDSAKTIQGSLQPVLDFKTEKENVLTLKNTANLNLLIRHKRVVNLINKLEFSTYGKKVTVSGGYVHVEYRYLLSLPLRFILMQSRNGPRAAVWNIRYPRACSHVTVWSTRRSS